MKKLAIFINNLDGGGAERVTSILLEELKNNFEIHLVLLEDKIVYTIPEDVKVHVLLRNGLLRNGLLKIAQIPFYAFKYRALCKRLKIDISFSLLDIPNWTSCFLKKTGWKTRVAISQRNYVSDYINNFNGVTKRIYQFLIKALFNNADLIIPNAQAMANDLVDNYGIRKEKVCTIYNPLDVGQVLDRILSTKEKSLEVDKVNCLNMARLNERKNQKIIIEALGISKTKKVAIHFLGKGEEETNLKDCANRLGLSDRVFFHGFQKEPISYLRAADIFILSSNNEGFPNVLLEALACNKVIISTNCNSGPLELLSPDNPSPAFNEKGFAVCPYGILVEVDNATALAEALQYAINNLEELKASIKRDGTLKYVRGFDKSVIAKKFKGKLLSLIPK